MHQQFRIIAGMLSDKAAFLHCNSLTFFRLGILFSVVSRLMFTSMPVTGNNSKVMFACPAQCRPVSTLECGARRACPRSAGVSFSSAFKSRVIMQLLISSIRLSMPLLVTNWVPVVCGWLRRVFFKACPPVACTIARPDLPARAGTHVDFRSSSIRGGASAPYLSGCARQPFNVRCAHYARGASLSTFGFVTIVPRYLLPQVIPSHSFAALTALIVRRISGFADRPMLCLYWLPARPPRRGIGVRTR